MKNYLNVVKEITVTDSFLSLDKETRGCQVESFDKCTTRNHINTLMNKCQCLPFQMESTKEVVRDAFQKKSPYGGTLSQLGGEGVKINFKMSLLKIPFY